MAAIHVRIQDVARHEGEQVTISGWLHNRRSSGKIHFLQLRDGSGFIQAVMSKAAVGEDVFSRRTTSRRKRRSSVTGTVRADARAPGGFELDVTGLEVHAGSARLPDHAEGARRRLPDGSPPPLAPLAAAARDPAGAARGDQRHPRLLRRAAASCSCDTPIFTPAACEGTTTLFEADYFDERRPT